jgi:SAM-dependent methyltransferase
MKKKKIPDAEFDPTRKVSNDDIKNYWKESSEKLIDDQGLKPTARDPFLQDLIEQVFLTYFNRCTNLLDVGCGDGTSSIKFANKCATVTGVDFIDSYISHAKIKAEKDSILNIKFYTEDIMRIAEHSQVKSKFNAISLIRVLINLGDWSNQRSALDQVSRFLLPGGLLLMSEGWAEGWNGLNICRRRAGLQPIELVKYNTLLKKSELEKHLARDFDLVGYHSFGFYIFMSRVFQPIFKLPDPPLHSHKINELAATMWGRGVGREDFEACDYAGVYVFKKR